MPHLILLTLSKLLMLPLISLTLIHLPLLIFFFPSNVDAPSCSILPPVSSQIHFSILFSLPTDSVNSPSSCPPHKVWLYHLNDFEHPNVLLCSIDSKELLSLTDPNASWAMFKELFLCIMTTTVPSKLVYLLLTLIFLGSTNHFLTMPK